MRLVSVLMSVYNSELYLKEAIDSILEQTYENFEFIIIDDCSNDSSMAIIKSYCDERIIVIKNKENIGLAASLNKSIKLSNGEYLIRMDADDISEKNRIIEQVKFMDRNLSIGVAGSYFKLIGESIPWYKKIIIRKGTINQKDSSSKLLFSPCVLHPSVIIRKKILTENNIFYNENFKRAQDYELWSRLIFVTEITNIPKVLFRWRISAIQSSIKDRGKQIEYSRLIHKFILKKLIGQEPSEQQLKINQWIISQKILSNLELKELDATLNNLITYTNSNSFFHFNSLKKEFSLHWLIACINSGIGLNSIQIYFNSKFGLINQIKLKHILIFLYKQ